MTLVAGRLLLSRLLPPWARPPLRFAVLVSPPLADGVGRGLMGGLPPAGVLGTLPLRGGGGGGDDGGVGGGGGSGGGGGGGGGSGDSGTETALSRDGRSPSPTDAPRHRSRSRNGTRGGDGECGDRVSGGRGGFGGRVRFGRALAAAAVVAVLFTAGSLVVVVQYGLPNMVGYVSAPVGGPRWRGVVDPTHRLATLLWGPTAHDGTAASPSRSLFVASWGGGREGEAKGEGTARVLGASMESPPAAVADSDDNGNDRDAGDRDRASAEVPQVGMADAIWGADGQAIHALHRRYRVPRRVLRRLHASAAGRLLSLLDAAAATAAARDNPPAGGHAAPSGAASFPLARVGAVPGVDVGARVGVGGVGGGDAAAVSGTGGESAAVPAVLVLRVDAATVAPRLRALATALVYARHSGRVPVVMWHVTGAFPYPLSAVFPAGLGGDDVVTVDVVCRSGVYGLPLWAAASGRQVSSNVSVNGGMRLSAQPGVDADDTDDWAELNTEVVDQHGVGADAIGGAAPPFAPGVRPSRRLTLTALAVEPTRASRHLILRSNDWLDSAYAPHAEAVETLWSRVMGRFGAIGNESEASLVAPAVAEVQESGGGGIRGLFRQRWSSVGAREAPPVGRAFSAEWTAFAERFVHPSLSDADVFRLLHDKHDVPSVFLDGMAPLMRRRFLSRLQAATADQAAKFQARLARFDADAASAANNATATTAPRPTPPPTPKAMFVHTQYGLGNRLRALGSALAFARAAGRVLVLVWAPDAHLQCTFDDLFVNDLVSQSELSLTFPFRQDATYRVDGSLRRIRKYSFMRHNSTHVLDPNRVAVANDVHHHLYVSTAYVIRSSLTPSIITMDSPYWSVLRSLIPAPTVLRRVESVQARVDASSSPATAAFASSGTTRGLTTMVGVHIRSRPISTDIAGVTAADYSPTAAAITDYWRSVTGVSTFLSRMRAAPPGVRFFVATDTPGVYEELVAALDSSRVVRLERPPCPDRTAACVQLALADLLALSRTRLILGSHWSSFSEAAGRLGNKRLLLAGLHFGRPQTRRPR